MAEAASSLGLFTELEPRTPSDYAMHTIHEASELTCSVADGDDHASCDFHVVGSLLGRVNPGQSLQPPKTMQHTDQLYADHAKRAERLQQKRELADLDRAEHEMQERRQFVRRGNENELEQVCQRLYEDATRRRQDAVRKNVERQMQEDEERRVHAFGDKTVAAACTGTPRWQELYDKGLQRRKELHEKRKQLQEEEMQRLQEESLHSRGVGDEAQGKVEEAIERLMEDSRRRINVQSRRARVAKEEALRRQAGQQFSSLADLQDGINRLYYQDQQRRQEWFQEQTEALRVARCEMLLSGSRVLSVEEANARFNQLYDDASRREKVRRQATERALREEEESLREQSVHATVLQKHWQPAEVQEIFNRIANGRASPPYSGDTLAYPSSIAEIPTVVEECSGVTNAVGADSAVLEGMHESTLLADLHGTQRKSLEDTVAVPPMTVSCSNLDVADAGAGPSRPTAALQIPAGRGYPRSRTATTPLRARRLEERSEVTTITAGVMVPSKTFPGGLLPPPRAPPDPQHHEQSLDTIPCASPTLRGEKTPEAKTANESRIHGVVKGRGHSTSQVAQPGMQSCVGHAASLTPRQQPTAVTPQKLVAPSVTPRCLRTPPGVQLGP